MRKRSGAKSIKLKNDVRSAANRAGQIAICLARAPRPGRYRHGSKTPGDGTELISGIGDHQGYLETTLLLNSDAFDALLITR